MRTHNIPSCYRKSKMYPYYTSSPGAMINTPSGSIPGLATYFRFSFRFFHEGQLSVTGESMCMKYWLTT